MLICHCRGISDRDIRATVAWMRASDPDTIEAFALDPGEARYDLAVAVRVGVLDGRHPQQAHRALAAIAAALTPRGRLFIDGGDLLSELTLPDRDKEPRP